MSTDDNSNWWEGLEEQWKRAFNITQFNKGDSLEAPSLDQINYLLTTPALRLVGPEGPHPNLNFPLTNLSGIKGFKDLETLVVTHHAITSTKDLEELPKLKSFFLGDNQLEKLEGIERFKSLEQLFLNGNSLEDLGAIDQLSSLKMLNCAFNKIKSIPLPPNLKELYCLPNEGMEDAEVIRLEKKGIRCRRG